MLHAFSWNVQAGKLKPVIWNSWTNIHIILKFLHVCVFLNCYNITFLPPKEIFSI